MNWGLGRNPIVAHERCSLPLWCLPKSHECVITPKSLDSLMAENLGKVHDLLHDFYELLPPTAIPA